LVIANQEKNQCQNQMRWISMFEILHEQ
jgi:hypothetical protein